MRLGRLRARAATFHVSRARGGAKLNDDKITIYEKPT